MRLVFLVAALPLTGAIPRGPPGQRAETPDPKWDGPPYNPEDDGPRGRATNTESLATPNQTAASIPPTTNSFKVTILADSNRDGKVDITGITDLAGKERWTEESGALFLANIVDTNRRCSSQITGSCASDLSDIFLLGATVPEKPQAPKILETWNGEAESEWVKGLSETDKATYKEWKKKIQEYAQGQEEAQDVNRRISACHDSSDDILRNSTYLAPLRTMPNPGLSDSAIGSITVANETAASNVRLFHKIGGQWAFIASNYSFKAEDLKAGLELGIDARDVRRPGGWDGRAVVEFRVRDGEKKAKDSVTLRVAPVLTQHHGQPAKQLLTATGDGGPGQGRFIMDLKELSTKAGLKTPVHVFDTSSCKNEIWVQDFFEPGYMSIPGPNGPVSMHIMIRSAQDSRGAGHKIFQDLRSNTVGAVQHLAHGDTTDSTGNLETVPPYTHNGKSYTAGRAVMGSAGGKKPYMMAFLEAQETQVPIELDTSWLAVKHIDEFIQFLPVESECGWVMVVDDPRAGLEILQKTQQAGHGKEMAVSRPKLPGDSPRRVTNTIDDVLNTPNFAGFQNACASNIEKNIDIIKRETGITDAEIFRIPSLYEVYNSTLKRGEVWQYAQQASNEKQRRQVYDQVHGHENRELAELHGGQLAHDSEQDVDAQILDALKAGTPPQDLEHQPATVTARSLEGRQERANGPGITLYPGTINSVVLGDKILAPNPWGPVIEGKDVLAVAVNEAYGKANYTVLHIDDWFTHHEHIGEVHCGSNVIRELPTVKWW